MDKNAFMTDFAELCKKHNLEFMDTSLTATFEFYCPVGFHGASGTKQTECTDFYTVLKEEIKSESE